MIRGGFGSAVEIVKLKSSDLGEVANTGEGASAIEKGLSAVTNGQSSSTASARKEAS